MGEKRRGQETVLLLCSVLLGDDLFKMHFLGSHYTSAAFSWLQPGTGRRMEEEKGKVSVSSLPSVSHRTSWQ